MWNVWIDMCARIVLCESPSSEPYCMSLSSLDEPVPVYLFGAEHCLGFVRFRVSLQYFIWSNLLCFFQVQIIPPRLHIQFLCHLLKWRSQLCHITLARRRRLLNTIFNSGKVSALIARNLRHRYNRRQGITKKPYRVTSVVRFSTLNHRPVLIFKGYHTRRSAVGCLHTCKRVNIYNIHNGWTRIIQ